MADPRPAASADDLLADLTSRDAQRIWSASSAVLGTWDDAVLDHLAAHVEDVETATAGVDLGGALITNASRLRQSLDRLRHHRHGAGCLCEMYTSWLLHDPEKEAAAGHVLLGPAVDRDQRRRVTCVRCGTPYDVEEGEYHYTWWSWRPVAGGRSR